MKKFRQLIFLICGLLLTLAAFPVFAQEEKTVSEIQISRKPLQDFEKLIRKEIATGKVDLSKSFLIELEGVLDKNGRLNAKESSFVKSEGDAVVVDIAKSFVGAVADSGWLVYLRQIDVEKMNLTFAQDDSQTYAVVVSELPTAERAERVASALNRMVSMALERKEIEAEGIDQDEKFLIGGIKAERADKILTIRLTYEKSAVRELINRLLKENKTKQSSEK